MTQLPDAVTTASYDIEDAALELADALDQSRGLETVIPERAVDIANRSLRTTGYKLVKIDA